MLGVDIVPAVREEGVGSIAIPFRKAPTRG